MAQKTTPFRPKKIPAPSDGRRREPHRTPQRPQSDRYRQRRNASKVRRISCGVGAEEQGRSDMREQNQVALEIRDGYDVGRDPRQMSHDELRQTGHKPISPLKALRLKCLECCCGSANEVRLCTAVDCPSWPFRLGKSPWRSPMSAKARAERAEQMRRNRISGSSSPDKTLGAKGTHGFDGSVVPSDPSNDFSQINLGSNPEGAK